MNNEIIYRVGSNAPKQDSREAIKKARMWSVFSPLYIQNRDAEFVPVLESSLGGIAFAAARKKYKLSLVIIILYVVVFLVYGVISSDIKAINVAIVGFSFWLLLFLEFSSNYRSRDKLARKARFYIFLLKDFREAIIFSSLLAISLIILEIIQLNYGREFFIKNYGLMYEAISKNEFWRFLTGGFLHSSIQHFLINISFIFVAIIFMVNEKWYVSLSLFISGVVFGGASAYLGYLLGATSNNAFVGVSGGIYCLFGWVCAQAYKYPFSFPFKFFTLSIIFVIANAIASILMAENTSNLSHMGGWILGFVMQFIVGGDKHVCLESKGE